jgi:hypothetical protein
VRPAGILPAVRWYVSGVELRWAQRLEVRVPYRGLSAVIDRRYSYNMAPRMIMRAMLK